ncbi:hypothetical protein M3484_04875 [Pseudomonas sp. GX19020]|uniref:hypothetical protein n=1 Tax=Pseudomonas sp. GX19020 TaxID=2942277 RepID=UPI002019C51E|nr:hypothetical protein [Pseudomonas sp. GX19020]MCL4065894.1 hypothetical protein [Pseudomonas sp. GX19020]
MMPLLYRLRRSVALFVCPELSAESRLKATLAEARKMRAPEQLLIHPAPRLSMWQRISASLKRFEESPEGDFFGMAVLFILLVLILCIGGR